MLALCIAYLLIDYSILFTTRSGGYLVGGLVSYLPQPLLLLKYIQDESGERLEILDERMWNSPSFSTDDLKDQIFVYQPTYCPIWAPTKRIYPKARFRLGSNKQLPLNLLELATAAANEHTTISADYVRGVLAESSHTDRTLNSGIVRNYAVLTVLGLLAITLLLVCTNLILLRKLGRAIRSYHCTCGYSHAGLIAPTCPECGRTIDATPAQSSTTLDA